MTGHSHYHHRRPASQRSLSEYETLPQSPSPYPGISPYNEYPEVSENALYPYPDTVSDPEATASALAPSTNSGGGGGLAALLGGGGSGGSGGGLGKLLGGLGVNNMNDVKNLIDRMGGIEGIVNNIGKVQKVMQGFQQLAPMFSVLAGALGKKKGGGGSSPASHTDTHDDGYEYRPRKRRSSGSRRRSGTRRTSGSSKTKRRR